MQLFGFSVLLAALAAGAPLAFAEPDIQRAGAGIVRVDRPGPPPHAPAHGYRHKHKTHTGHVELVFDSGLGLYLVVGRAGYYWHDDHYYRELGGRWEISLRLDQGWSPAPAKGLPPGLAKKATRGKGQKKGGPAKHGY